MAGFDRTRYEANIAEGRAAWSHTRVVMLLAIEPRAV
jgi:hypothetical protein